MEEKFSFDVSTLSYEDFLLYFLTNCGNELWELDFEGNTFILPTIEHPEVVVRYLTRFHNEFRQIADRVELTDLDHGISGMLSPAFFQLQKTLWDSTVDLQERINCVRSMYRIFADFVPSGTGEPPENSFYMWWDLVCTSFWFAQIHFKKLPGEEYNLLSSEDRQLADAMFETLVQILNLDNQQSNSSALHGLGHLHHPEVRGVVQKFIDTHRFELDAKGISWLERCRDGTVM